LHKKIIPHKKGRKYPRYHPNWSFFIKSYPTQLILTTFLPLATTKNFTARTPERTSILYYLRRLAVYDLLSLKIF